MTTTIAYTGQLTVTNCWCGIRFAVPAELARLHDEQGHTLHCPLGHATVRTRTDNQLLQDELREKEREIARQRALRDQAEADARYQKNRANGYKGAAAKTKKRVAKGVCPAPGCKRSFVNVAKHVASCHPDFEQETIG